MINWYARQHLDGCKYIPELLEPALRKLQPYGPVSVQWNLQPFELLGLASVDNLVLLAKIDPEQYRKTCDNILSVNIELLKAVFNAGADFVFLGGPGVEMMSPEYYRTYVIPDSQKISAAVHDAGGMVYSHICSPIEPFLTMGFYNEMGIDLFETLSPPPVGNVADLAKARRILNKDICTRGNIGLDVLLTGSIEDVEKATLKIMDETRGFKHYVAASDYLFYDVPLENVRTMVRMVES
jgi:uroporphyrinogen-III decarboxylase